MKKTLAMLLAFVLVACTFAFAGTAEEATYGESPMLSEKVANGELPPVAERLPDNPKVFDIITDEYLDYQIGTYGGTMRCATTSIGSSDTVNRMLTEPLLTYQNMDGNTVTGNILEGYEVSEDEMTFTFYMRKGLRWSDGEYVTTEDVAFTFNDMYCNTEFSATVPAWLCARGNAANTPAQLVIVDDYTFQLVFDQPYAGLIMRLAIKNWCMYYDLINPAHFLKQFHPAYASAEEIQALMDEGNFDSWVAMFNYHYVGQFEEGHEEAIGYPVLNAWMASEYTESYWKLERNPYYFLTDKAGNQLPYIDYITCEYVNDPQVFQMKMVAGEVDYEGFKGSLNNMALYMENAEQAGFKVVMTKWHTTGNDIYFALAHDPEDPVTAVLNDKTFREACNYAINKEELLDTIYLGFGELSTITPNTYDLDKANELLDTILPMGDDGLRNYPDGSDFQLQIICAELAPDIAPTAELVAEMLRGVGIDATSKIVDAGLRGQMIGAAEHESVCMWTEVLWFNFGQWALGEFVQPWYSWWTTNGVEGTEPPQEWKDIFAMFDKMHGSNLETSLETFEEIKKVFGENFFIIRPCDFVYQPLIANAHLQNLDFIQDPWGINVTFAGKIFWFDNLAE